MYKKKNVFTENEQIYSPNWFIGQNLREESNRVMHSSFLQQELSYPSRSGHWCASAVLCKVIPNYALFHYSTEYPF